MTDDDPGIRDFEPDVHDHVVTLFPVEVALPDGTVIQRGKVFVMVGGVLVYAERDGAPLRVFAGRHTEPARVANLAIPKRRQHSVFVTHAGKVFTTGVLGCGCGSSLKLFTLDEALA